MKLISLVESSTGKPLFFLRGKSSSYVLGVNDEGFLCHLHWGGPVAPSAAMAAFFEQACIAFSPGHPKVSGGLLGLDMLRLEYPTANTGDFRLPALDVRHADGTQGLRLFYAGHRIAAGKPALASLPATYVEDASEAETLEVDLRDELGGIAVTLLYSVFAGRDVVARSARIRNTGGGPVTLLRALSMAADLRGSDFDMLHLPGAWARERWIERQPLHSGAQLIGSRRGASSHQYNPFFALLEPSATETTGAVRGVSLVYSGSHVGGAEVDQVFNTRIVSGINPEGFSWHLAPGAEFQTPEVVLAYSAEGLGGLSRQYHHLYRERLARGVWRDRERPVLVNNWEGTYFDFTADKLVLIAQVAARTGVELFVLDDGWFGKRDDDTTSLGDWFVDEAKLPGGLAPLVRRINDEGLAFGLWFEPEMISAKSELYRAHPDWCLHMPARSRTEGRQQFVLDFSRDEVVQAIGDQMAAILHSAPIRYIKWDMNRHLTEIGSAGWPAEQQGEVAHRHILGVYKLMDRLTTEFPEILFESCSGGGGRFDPGILYYMPQTWTSDNSDAISRLKIQYGTSLVFPPCTMGAHVSAVPNHQVFRTTSLRTRGYVALAGQFGFELDLTALPEEEIAEMTELVQLVKETRHLLRMGDFHRLSDPFAGHVAAWEIVSPDRGEALVTATLAFSEPNFLHLPLKLRGLDPAARYRVVHGPEGEWPGDVLMELGLPVAFKQDFDSILWHLKRV